VSVLKNIVQRADEIVDLFLATDERGEEFDDVDVVGRHLGQDPMAMKEGHHHHLGENGGAKPLECLEPPP
jgi:hypothetical protein